ncbi:hypothetical protein [Mycetocola miduiensis]|uniref:Uncharacterized protein n=1 Tax=Mycetocola miduiensis TaxID=995034 RepID=A0A1I5AJA3_9MICO|nr:hypothetical protein [Mycetocola miduiensis]SFN62462.1 hypothetical protein SAMN05216219_1500 [Mycetocola miduiensis]
MNVHGKTPHRAGLTADGSGGRVASAQDSRARSVLRRVPPGAAVRTVVAVFGVLAAGAGVEHGIGEILQGSVASDGPFIRSWPDTEAFDVLGGEPALTVLPTMLLSGIVTVIVASGLGIWAIIGVHRRYGGLVLIGLSLLLLLVGGGFGPPLLAIILGLGGTWLTVPSQPPRAGSRAFARVWPWALGAGVVGYLGLVPGMLILNTMWGEQPTSLTYALMMLAFGGVILAVLAARTGDRLLAWSGVAQSDADRGVRKGRTR